MWVISCSETFDVHSRMYSPTIAHYINRL